MTAATLEHWVHRYIIVCNSIDPGPEFVVEIDHRAVTALSLHERLRFWDDKVPARAAPVDVLNRVLRHLGLVILGFVLQDYNLEGVIARFADGVEGWPKMDGSEGWRIISVDTPSFELTDFSIEGL